MPIIYPKKIRDAMQSIDLSVLRKEIESLGYEFVREGHYSKEKEPFWFCNYLHYLHPVTKVAIRIGYDYGFLRTKEDSKDLIFEICWARDDMRWWSHITPDFRKQCWRKVSKRYINK